MPEERPERKRVRCDTILLQSNPSRTPRWSGGGVCQSTQTYPMIKPLFNPMDDEWAMLVGRFMLNMGVIEMATRLLIARIHGTVFNADLDARIGFVRSRFPRENNARHKWAMKAFGVALKHVDFRNIVAHSPLAITGYADGSYRIQGIMNVTPKSKDTIAELISIEELTGRVTESAVVARQLLEMQNDFLVAS
jgi:hypothetical protein